MNPDLHPALTLFFYFFSEKVQVDDLVISRGSGMRDIPDNGFLLGVNGGRKSQELLP